VTEITWWDAVKWCNALSQIDGRKPVYYTAPDFNARSILKEGTPPVHADWDADGYRLPTEAEWENAWWQHGFSRDGKFLEPDGWSHVDSGGNTHPVASRPSHTSKQLDDMLGNVAEWCWDWKAPLVRFKLETDPRGPAEGPHRVFRGGSWADHPVGCLRWSYRGDFSPVAPASYFVGFRPARNAVASDLRGASSRSGSLR
jgi:formylglycine-generating enzyme required for sulfatase activity